MNSYRVITDLIYFVIFCFNHKEDREEKELPKMLFSSAILVLVAISAVTPQMLQQIQAPNLSGLALCRIKIK